MHLLSVDRVTASVEGRTLFADVSFGLSSQDRVGVVGPNGSGKTTLLSIVAGLRRPEAGSVVTRRGLRIGWLPQEPERDALTALELVLGSDVTARRHEAEAMLERVGVAPDLELGRASGGQRRRAALARTLLLPSDLLVLDEPTNHLDVDMIDWLEQELARRACGLLLVTHDRYVLERLTTRMLDLAPRAPGEPADPWWHDGSYSDLLEARAQRAAARDRSAARARNLLAKEVAWLRRDPRARTSKPRFRLQQVEALRSAAAGDLDAAPLELGTGASRLGDDVFELEAVTLRRGQQVVFDSVDLGIGPGERVGVVGPNGAGKSSLLHLLAGRLSPDAGRLRVGRTVHAGLYEQEAVAAPTDDSVLDTVLAIAAHVPLANGETLPAHRLAERFGFDGTLQRTPVASLSGGERRRLALLHLLVAAPNVILLDEPTNDLDLDTLATLEDHLDGFTGTLVVASHDRYVLERLTDRTIAIEGHDLVERRDLADARRADGATAASTGSDPSPDSDERAAVNRRRQAERRRARSLEQQMERLHERREQIHQEMAHATTDPQALLELQRDLAEVEEELDEVENAWLAATVE